MRLLVLMLLVLMHLFFCLVSCQDASVYDQQTASSSGESEFPFFTITEEDYIADGTRASMMWNEPTVKAADEVKVEEEEEEEEFIEVEELGDHQIENSRMHIQAVSQELSMWEMFKTQIKNDFAPFIIIADKTGLSNQLKKVFS
jgi:hypothetical protein